MVYTSLGSTSRFSDRMSRIAAGMSGIHRQSHHPAEPALAHPLLDGLQEVLRFQLLDGDLRVPGDTEGMGLDHLHPGEEGADVRGNELLQEQQRPRRLGPVPRKGARRTQLQEPRERGGKLDPGKPLRPGGVADHQGEVQAHVGDVRETDVPGSTASGVRTGKTTSLEISVRLRLLIRGEGRVVDDPDPRLRQQRERAASGTGGSPASAPASGRGPPPAAGRGWPR